MGLALKGYLLSTDVILLLSDETFKTQPTQFEGMVEALL